MGAHLTLQDIQGLNAIPEITVTGLSFEHDEHGHGTGITIALEHESEKQIKEYYLIFEENGIRIDRHSITKK